MKVYLTGLLVHLQRLPNPKEYNEHLSLLHPNNKPFFQDYSFYLDEVNEDDENILGNGKLKKITPRFDRNKKGWIIEI